MSSSIEINLGLEAERDGLLKQVDELKDLCIDLRYQLRQTDGLRINCEAAEKLAEDRRAVCEVLTREVFALTCVNESLKAHIQQFLEQASTRPARRPNKPSNPASQSHKR